MRALRHRFAFWPLALVLLATACSSTPMKSEEELIEEEAAAATDACLKDPALARSWGECNVKRTIFDRMDQIGACQKKHGKPAKPGDVSGAMLLTIHLKQDGRVQNVKAEQSKNKPLEACLGKEISKLKFASPPKGVKPVIYFPYQM